MTLDDFLDDYVPRVLKPMGDWFVSPRKCIVRDADTEWCCPMTAIRDRARGEWEAEAEWLELSSRDALALRDAADDDEDADQSIRARLLAGLGLQEPA